MLANITEVPQTALMPRYLDGLMPNTSVRIAVPKAWKTLLDIEDFDALARPPEKWRELDSSPASILRHSTSSTPYRDDEREIFHIYGDRHVLLRLHSGDINYWYSIEVFEKKPDEKDFENALAIHVFSDQVSFNIPAETEIALRDGSLLTLEIVTENS